MATEEATAKKKEKEAEVSSDQFRRNLDHILINTDVKGPEITIGLTVLTFKEKAPVTALAALISSDNRVEGMKQYILQTLAPGQEENFEALLSKIDIDGLGAILEVLGEGYTSFPDK